MKHNSTFFGRNILILQFLIISIFSHSQCPEITCPSNINTVVEPGECGAVVTFTAPEGTDPCSSGSITFNHTGGIQTFTVPVGVFEINIDARGASGGIGGSINNIGGLGGRATGTLSVTPGDVLNIYVGGAGGNRSTTSSVISPGGYNGGGNGGFDNSTQNQNGGGGGGASDIRVGGVALANRVIVAGGGGGGGAGFSGSANGGAGGGFNGNNGTASNTGAGGTGGTQVAGGVVATGAFNATNGVFGVGGNGSSNSDAWGSGGGGGGWYGGGGGTVTALHGSGWSGGGGGGSSYIGGVTGGTTTSGFNSGNGSIILSWSGAAATTTQIAGLPSGSTFPVGTTTQTFQATDAFGNTATCSFDIIVVDNENPVISNCPTNITQGNDPGNCNAVVTWTAPTANDNCNVASFTSNFSPGDVFPLGTTTVTYTATDDAGNTATCSFDVTVNDTEDPVISNCPSNITQSNDPGNCDAVVTWTEPTAADNCTMSSFTSTHSPGDVFNVGTTTVTYTAIDNAGNTSTCSFDVTVNDTEDPVIFNCPANITQSNDPGNCDAVVTWTEPTAADNCNLASFTSNYSSGDVFPTGTTTVIYTATDDAGNTATCSFDITINETEDPVIANCPTNITQNNDPGNCDAVVSWTVPTATDNCGIDSFTSNFNSGDVFPEGTTTVTYTAVDDAGNTATCSFDVIVVDNENPVISNCPTNIAQGNDPGNCNAIVTWTAPTANDNCNVASFTSNFSPGDVFPLGTTTVTYTATDDAGNTATCSFDVTVNDTEDPVISNCPTNITQSNDPGNCDAVVTWTEPTAADNCTLSSFTSTHSPGDVFNVGTTTVTYTAIDNAGNTSTCSFDVTVSDTEDPVISNCPANITQSNDPGNCDAVVTWTEPTAADNCNLASFTSNYSSGDVFPTGTTTVIYTATDDAGNTATCSFDVTVNETEDPVITNCPSDITQNNDPGNCDAVVSWTLPTATDNCGIDSFTSNFNSGDVFPEGTTTVTYTAVDDAGNTATCSFDITVNDTEYPSILDIPTDTIEGCTNIPVSWGEITAIDNCPDVDLTSSHNSGELFPQGITEVTYTATDNAGNTSQESFIIFIRESPNVSIIESAELYCVGKEMLLESTSSSQNLDYEWYFENNLISTSTSIEINNLTIDNSGTYSLYVFDDIGCEAGDSVLIDVQVCKIIVSEVMTPNGDGLNDNFIIENINAFPNTKVSIVNRWGNEVYQSNDYQNNWDGRSQSKMNVGGDELPEGTYFYIIELGGDPSADNYGNIYKGYFYLKR